MDAANICKTRKTAVIVNASAGTGRDAEWAAELNRQFCIAGMDVDCRRRRQIDPYAGILLAQPKTLKSVAYARVTPI